MIKNNAGVSIIICCYNSSALLEQTLLHISSLDLSENIECEVILVDNASTDDTQTTAINLWNKFQPPKIEFKVVYEAIPGLSFARKRGITEAHFEYLIFCDDDNWLEKDYVKNVYNLFEQNPQVAILGGESILHINSANTIPVWLNKFYSSYAIGKQSDEEMLVNSVQGAGMCARNTIINTTIGLQPLFLLGRNKNNLTAGEDSEICLRILLNGYKILYSPKLKLTHHLIARRLNWSYVKKMHIGFAQTNVILGLYEYAVSTNKQNLSSFYWLKKAFYYAVIYFKYWPKQYRVYSKTEGTVEEINHISWGVIALSYLRYNFKTTGIYKKIITLKRDNKAEVYTQPNTN